MTDKKYLLIKRIAEICLAVIIILLMLPFSILTALALTIILKSSPIIKQERGITAESNLFNIFKFRTIRPNNLKAMADKEILYKQYLEEYVPAFCRWLRKTGLDELPQLINVLNGNMSLIGPRPLMLNDLEIMKSNFPVYYEIRKSITAKPGITGLWQVSGRREEGIENLIYHDNQYNKSVSFSLDLKIFLSTIPLVLKGNHSDAIISNENDNKYLGDINFINFISNEV